MRLDGFERSNCTDYSDERKDTERNDVQVTCLPVLLMFYPYPTNVGGPGSSVGIATELRAGRSGIESRWGRDFPPPRPALGPTQPPVKWVLGISRG